MTESPQTERDSAPAGLFEAEIDSLRTPGSLIDWFEDMVALGQLADGDLSNELYADAESVLGANPVRSHHLAGYYRLLAGRWPASGTQPVVPNRRRAHPARACLPVVATGRAEHRVHRLSVGLLWGG